MCVLVCMVVYFYFSFDMYSLVLHHASNVQGKYAFLKVDKN